MYDFSVSYKEDEDGSKICIYGGEIGRESLNVEQSVKVAFGRCKM